MSEMIMRRLYKLLDVYASLERIISDPAIFNQYVEAIVREEARSLGDMIAHEIEKRRVGLGGSV